MRILPVAGNDRLLPESAFNDPMLARHEVHHRARRRPLHFSRRRCCGSRTPIWVVLGGLARIIHVSEDKESLICYKHMLLRQCLRRQTRLPSV